VLPNYYYYRVPSTVSFTCSLHYYDIPLPGHPRSGRYWSAASSRTRYSGTNRVIILMVVIGLILEKIIFYFRIKGSSTYTGCTCTSNCTYTSSVCSAFSDARRMPARSYSASIQMLESAH
jgi:hypothetical protein